MLLQHPPSFNGFVYEYFRNITEITEKVRSVKVLVENNFQIFISIFEIWPTVNCFIGKMFFFVGGGGGLLGNLFFSFYKYWLAQF